MKLTGASVRRISADVDDKKPYCFEVYNLDTYNVITKGSTLRLQASSQLECEEWIEGTALLTMQHVVHCPLILYIRT